MQEYNCLPGQDTWLSERYTDLLIVQRHKQQKEGVEQRKEREEEICFRGPTFFRAMESKAYQRITMEKFFDPSDDKGCPKAVIVSGHSGYGKSFMVQKIMFDWASGKLYHDRFELLLHLRCKDLNQFSKSMIKRSVVDLMSCSQEFTPLILQKLKESPQKVLILVDGFDELLFPMDEVSDSPVNDIFTPFPVQDILIALFRGLVFPDCFLLVTTRSTAADKLSKLLKRPVCFTEIVGFSEKGVQEYFQKFFQDEQVSEKAMSYVRANETLLTICSVPVICWIVCTFFGNHIKTNADITDDLETTTSIFVHFVLTLLEHHCSIKGSKDTPNQPMLTLLRSLGQLAESGMIERQVLFEKESVLRTVADPDNVPFLCKVIVTQRIKKREMFSFMHLVFQEFFTALNYILEQNENKLRGLLNHIQECNAMSNLLSVIQFLFGLSNSKVMQDMEDCEIPSSLPIRVQLEVWILGLIENSKATKESHVMQFILYCLYEHHEMEFVSRAMGVWGDIAFSGIALTRTDCWVLLYCLQCCQAISSLTLKHCNLTVEKLKILQPALSLCKELG